MVGTAHGSSPVHRRARCVSRELPHLRRPRDPTAPGALARGRQVDREVWRKAGAQGFLCPNLSDKYGGAGGDFVYSVVVMEELARAYESGFAMALHSDICVPYIESFGSEEQKQRWLPKIAQSGELVILAICDDRAGDRFGPRQRSPRPGRARRRLTTSSTAPRRSSPTAINCQLSDPHRGEDRPRSGERTQGGISLILVDTDTRRVQPRASKIAKIGQHGLAGYEPSCSSPTAGSRSENLLGEEGTGFYHDDGQARSPSASAWPSPVTAGSRAGPRRSPSTYVKQRTAFGQADRQASRTHAVRAGRAAVAKVTRSPARIIDSLIDGPRPPARSPWSRSARHGQVVAAPTLVGEVCRQGPAAASAANGYMLEDYPISQARGSTPA